MVSILAAVGLVLLLVGANLLVRGASGLAQRFSVPPLVIGLTVVAYGTSAPELAVSLQAAAAGQADIALGNVLGSNIFNVLFILGLAAMLVPLRVSTKLVRLDVPIMIGVSFLLAILGWDGRLSPLEGALMVAAGIAYTVFLIVEGKREANAEGVDEAPAPGTAVALLLIAVGLGMLVLGSRWLVAGAVALAAALGVSELVIGLTVIAAGTSLPEVATSIVASLKGERDIAIGNVVGSNIFNILWVLGSAAAAGGVAVSAQARALDIPVMIAVAVLCLPIFFTGSEISRPEGVLFFAGYLAYTAYLALTATGSAALPTFTGVISVALPLTVVGLLVFWARSARAG